MAWRLHVSSKPLLSSLHGTCFQQKLNIWYPSSGLITEAGVTLSAFLPSTMANQIKQYFLAPSWDYPPNGSIALGNIIVSPTRPVPALVTRAATPTAGSEGLISSTKQGVEWQKGKTNAHQFGIWTKLLVFSSLLLFLSLKPVVTRRQSMRGHIMRASLAQNSNLCTCFANRI